MTGGEGGGERLPDLHFIDDAQSIFIYISIPHDYFESWKVAQANHQTKVAGMIKGRWETGLIQTFNGTYGMTLKIFYLDT